jgi:nucleoid DNA-binding protein
MNGIITGPEIKMKVKRRPEITAMTVSPTGLNTIIDAVFEELRAAMATGDEVSLVGIGKFKVASPEAPRYCRYYNPGFDNSTIVYVPSRNLELEATGRGKHARPADDRKGDQGEGGADQGPPGGAEGA